MKNKLFKKGLALFLSAFFLLSQSATAVAAAEMQTPSQEAEIDSSFVSDGNGIGVSQMENKPVSDAEHKTETNGGEISAPTETITEADTNNFSDASSVSESEEETASDANLQEVSDETEESASEIQDEETVSALEAPSGPMQITDLNKDEKVFKISLNQYTMPADGKELLAAVWSDVKGQDDLRWYPLAKTSDGYGVNVEIQNHKTAGSYAVHIYLRQKDGQLRFVCKDTFSVADTTMESLEVLQDPSNPAKATLVLHQVAAPSGVTSITVPVWSRSDQQDIVWYQATKKADGNWTVDLNYSSHKNSVGNEFIVHVYGTSGNGIFSKIGDTRVTLEKGKPIVEVKTVTNGLVLSLDQCSVNTPKDVQFAVWSDYNGQDDLKWYTVTGGSNGRYSKEIPYLKETGSYQIHCYARDTAGKMIFQEKTTYTMKLPSAGKITALVPEKTDGSFTLTIEDIVHPEMIKEIAVPVWSKADQSDLVWYQAAQQADGTWQVKGHISKHKGNSGKYIAHVYIKDLSGTSRYACGTDFYMDAPPMTVDAVYTNDYSYIEMTASNINIADGVKEVRFAVWSSENGQDDIRWYIGKLQNVVYKTTAKVENHKGQGPLIVHAYAESTKGKMVFLKSFELPVQTTVQASFRFEDFSEERFSSDLYIDLSDYTMAIKYLDIAVWSAADQSDIYWYHADRSSDKSWHTAFSPVHHKGHSGTFNVHAYVTFSNGIQVFAGKTQYNVTLANKHYVLENADGTVTAVLYSDKTLTSPQIAVWSQTNGQDDLKWYPLTYDGTCYSAKISIRNHKHTGLYYGHFYANNTFQGAVTFTFPETMTSTETVSKTSEAGHSDVKFFNRKLLCSIGGNYLALRNFDGSIFRNYMDLHGFWLDVLESDGLIVYTNGSKQVGLAKLDANYNVMWNRILCTMPNLTIDPCIVKNGSEYILTATEIQGNANNDNPELPNGIYTIHSWKSSDLVNWTESTDITTENHNLEEIKIVEKDGILYMAYEREVVDKGISSILGRISYDHGASWSDPIELLPADCDHEICTLSANGDRLVLFYSSDRDSLGSSYMGAKAYYAVFDQNMKCISKDVEIKTGAKGGILMYDVTWIDSTHYILYSENYLTTGTLVVEKAR